LPPPARPRRRGDRVNCCSCCNALSRSWHNPAAKSGWRTLHMKRYVTYRSPYARLARIIVIEKALDDRVKIIEARTRTPNSPYYQINPSGRVPYLVDDTGVGMEDSQLICAYLDA